jgi:hypothetical protein
MSKINTEVKATSIKRINANRENAKKSTGPKTTSGKFRSCRNALKHGLDSRKHLIIGEELREFEEMKESYIKMLEPSNIIEVEDCMQIIAMSWKIRRFSVVETGLYNQDMMQQLKSSTNELSAILLKRADFESVAKELDQVPVLQGLSFRWDCKEENANIKLNTMYVRLTITRNKLLENYFARKNWNKNKKIH